MFRMGPSSSAPNHANYDEATANPYPKLPDVLTLKNGKPVKTAAAWEQRRKEIIEDFDREVLGGVPKSCEYHWMAGPSKGAGRRDRRHRHPRNDNLAVIAGGGI